MNTLDYDVIILGSGIVGSVEAAILAKEGHRVLLIEKGAHPRFALGESTLPQASYWMWFISERYGLPELQSLADASSVARHVSRRCGIKRSLGFAYHRPGRPQDVQELNHFVPPAYPYVSESHFYREDVDLYMVKVAQDYGAELREKTEVVDLSTDNQGVWVKLKDGEELTARYLIDATGGKSVVAHKFGLREAPTRLETQSRCIFTHARNLKSYEDLFEPGQLPSLSHGLHHGTLHHLFDGGWFWVIPFDNHPDSTNGLASIGLMLDLRKHPDRGLPPEQEVREILDRFPSIAAHFEGIEPTMPWIATGRLQYSSTRAVGPRYFITPQAYGAVDALFSRGLISSMEGLYYFTHRLLSALEEDDFSPERFAPVDEAMRHQLDSHDQMVSTSYRALHDYATWNAWLKVWVATKLYGDLWLMRTALRYMHSRDKAVLEELDAGVHAPFAERMQAHVDLAARLIREAEAGRLPADDAAAQILDAMRDTEWLPHNIFGWGVGEERHADFSADGKMPRAIEWGKSIAPEWLRTQVFDFPLEPLAEAMA